MKVKKIRESAHAPVNYIRVIDYVHDAAKKIKTIENVTKVAWGKLRSLPIYQSININLQIWQMH